MLEEKVSTKLFHSKEQLKLVLSLIASMNSNRTLIFNELKFFIYDTKDQNIDLAIDRTLVDNNIFGDLQQIKIQIDGLSSELFGEDELKILLPIVEKGKDITLLFKECYKQTVKLGFIDDMSYHAYMIIINGARVFVDNGVIGFSFVKQLSRKRVKGGKATIDFENISLEDVLNKEIEQGYVNIEVGDPNRSFGYTHLLRANAKFYLTKWFRNVLFNWKKINVVYASRSQGKTYDAAYLVGRALLNPTPGFGGRPYREIKYFIDNKDTIGENFFRYVKSLLGDLLELKIDGKKVFKVNESSYTIECSLTGNRLEVVSLYKLTRGTSNELGDSTGEGIACDDAIIDEASRIPDKFWRSFFQRAAFETSSFFIITTANEETPVDHWSYELLIRGELGDEDIASYRITIDENEILKMSIPEEKINSTIAGIKEDCKKLGEEAYYARLYCIIFDKKKIFQISSNLIKRFDTDEKDFRVIILDPAKLSDNAGISVINVKRGIIEQAEKLINSDYDYQLKRIAELKKTFLNSVSVCDRGGAGEFLAETDKGGVIDVRIKSTGQGELSFNQKGYYTIAKGLMIGFLDTVFRKRVLNIFDDLSDLKEQLGKFVEIKSNRSKIILYKGEGKSKDDLVLSVANGVTYIYSVLGLHTKEEWENYSDQFDNYQIYSYNNEESVATTYYNPVY